MSYNFFVSDAVLGGDRARASCSPPHQCWTVGVGPDVNMLVRLPLGIEHARRRFPNIPFEPLPATGAVPPGAQPPEGAASRPE